MSILRVRAYNVRFGDALLISVPERTSSTETTRHILIDVGNVLSGQGGSTAVFKPVVDDLKQVLGGKPVDLYVMTHEHLDHIKGLPYAAEELDSPLKANYAWLTASAEPNYYDTHEKAKKKKLQLERFFEAMTKYFAAAPEMATTWVKAMLANNDFRDTAKCVQHLRQIAPAANTTYVHRQTDLTGRHPFTEAKFEIWGPEEDTNGYYGHFQPMALGVSDVGGTAAPILANPTPQPGVDAGAFFELIEARRRGWGDNLLAIDQAANNTSVVFTLTWRGWRLLFPGDAEVRAWKTMNKHGLLKPVHFLKVGHHGSHNGTPSPELLDKVLPNPAPDNRQRHAVVCTCCGSYNNVPDKKTKTELATRCTVQSVEGLCDGGHLDIAFEG